MMTAYQSKAANGFTVTATTSSKKTHHNMKQQTKQNLPLDAHPSLAISDKNPTTSTRSSHHLYAVAFDRADGIAFLDNNHKNEQLNNDDQINYSLQQQDSIGIKTATTATRSSAATEESSMISNTVTTTIIQSPQQQKAITSPSSTSSSSSIPAVSVWKRRLNTKEDKFGIHKISGISQTLSALTIFGIGATNGFQELPSILEPFTAIFCLFMLLQCITSFNLADSHRKLEPTVGNVFKSMGHSSLFIAIGSYWVAPFAPDIMNNPIVSKGMFSALTLTGAYLGLDAILNIETFTATQTRHDKDITNEHHKWSRAFVTIVPFLFTIPFNLSALYILGYLYDRQSLVELLFSTSGISAESVYYESIFSALGIGYTALYATLRDKKLISKDVEMFLTLLTAIPVLFVNFEQIRALLLII